MRGGVLSDPAVVGMLRPFIVTHWYGHRDAVDMPDVVHEHMRARRGARDRASNVFYLVLNQAGELVHSFDAFPHRTGGPPRRIAETVRREFAHAIERLELPAREWPEPPLRLPDHDDAGSLGLRVFVRLLDDRMRAYRAPVVETVPLSARMRADLAYPDEPREVDATALLGCLAQIYPPGVMERTDQRTKLVHNIVRADGVLTLAPVGSDRKNRYAILRGGVRLFDDGRDDFSYAGQLELILRYAPTDDRIASLKGTFDAVYPRPSRNHGTREVRLIAAIESRPR